MRPYGIVISQMSQECMYVHFVPRTAQNTHEIEKHRERVRVRARARNQAMFLW